jgi:hypothetical protein
LHSSIYFYRLKTEEGVQIKKIAINKIAGEFMLKYLKLFLIVVPVLCPAQIYTEVQNYGWGRGIDNTTPVIEDIDGDGLFDLLLGCDNGTIWHFEQYALDPDSFVFQSYKFSDIDEQDRSAPTITNIDGDSLLDLIIGDGGGRLSWYEQSAQYSYEFNLIDNYFNGIDVGARAIPFFTDFENDGILDLLIGQSLGEIFYYRQQSAGSDTFNLVTDFFLRYDVGTFSTPFVGDINNNGQLDLIIGNIQYLHHLEQDSVVKDTFHLVTTNFNNIITRYVPIPFFKDTDNDGLLDLFVGTETGMLKHYEQTAIGSNNYSNLINESVLGIRDFGLHTGFSVADINHNGRLDFLVPEYRPGLTEEMLYFEQNGSGSLVLELMDTSFNNIEIGNFYYPAFCDIDNNQLLDLIIGKSYAGIHHYEQVATGSYQFRLRNDEFNNNMNVGQAQQFAFTDLDGDSLLDMIVGEGDGNLNHFEQNSLNDTIFTLRTSDFNNIDVGYYSSPTFIDIDGDTLMDMIVGGINGSLRFYEQDSLEKLVFNLITDNYASINVENNSTPFFIDIDNDGLTDLLVGDRYGGISLFLQGQFLPPSNPQNLLATGMPGYSLLNWDPNQESYLAHYNVYRNSIEDTVSAIMIQSVLKPDTTYEDWQVNADSTYYYWITAVDSAGLESGFSLPNSAVPLINSIDQEKMNLPKQYALYQNYPNPFNPSTTIKFALPKSTHVLIEVYNVLGQKIVSLIDNHEIAGYHQIKFQAENLSSGIYFFSIYAGDFKQVRKMILLR